MNRAPSEPSRTGPAQAPAAGDGRADRQASPSARKRHARELFAALPRDYDRAGAIMSLGQDRRWRRALVEAVHASPGDRVLEVDTGTGLVAEALVDRWGCDVVGIDQSPEMLERAHARMRARPALASHVSLMRGEAERLPFADASFEHLTFTYLLRYVDDPAATLRELARVVRPGGRIAMLEFGVPRRGLLRAPWSVYTRACLPALGLLFSREWARTGAFLARSIPAFYARWPLERLLEEWHAAGVEAPSVRRMSFGAGLVMWGARGARRGGAGAA
jgi:demethylmenaquinone methyltransferase/2-methoxy-6-polyprenyl-1,4-benzoquinol methylase